MTNKNAWDDGLEDFFRFSPKDSPPVGEPVPTDPLNSSVGTVPNDTLYSSVGTVPTSQPEAPIIGELSGQPVRSGAALIIDDKKRGRIQAIKPGPFITLSLDNDSTHLLGTRKNETIIVEDNGQVVKVTTPSRMGKLFKAAAAGGVVSAAAPIVAEANFNNILGGIDPNTLNQALQNNTGMYIQVDGTTGQATLHTTSGVPLANFKVAPTIPTGTYSIQGSGGSLPNAYLQGGTLYLTDGNGQIITSQGHQLIFQDAQGLNGFGTNGNTAYDSGLGQITGNTISTQSSNGTVTITGNTSQPLSSIQPAPPQSTGAQGTITFPDGTKTNFGGSGSLPSITNVEGQGFYRELQNTKPQMVNITSGQTTYHVWSTGDGHVIHLPDGYSPTTIVTTEGNPVVADGNGNFKVLSNGKFSDPFNANDTQALLNNHISISSGPNIPSVTINGQQVDAGTVLRIDQSDNSYKVGQVGTDGKIHMSDGTILNPNDDQLNKASAIYALDDPTGPVDGNVDNNDNLIPLNLPSPAAPPVAIPSDLQPYAIDNQTGGVLYASSAYLANPNAVSKPTLYEYDPTSAVQNHMAPIPNIDPSRINTASPLPAVDPAMEQDMQNRLQAVYGIDTNNPYLQDTIDTALRNNNFDVTKAMGQINTQITANRSSSTTGENIAAATGLSYDPVTNTLSDGSYYAPASSFHTTSNGNISFVNPDGSTTLFSANSNGDYLAVTVNKDNSIVMDDGSELGPNSVSSTEGIPDPTLMQDANDVISNNVSGPGSGPASTSGTSGKPASFHPGNTAQAIGTAAAATLLPDYMGDVTHGNGLEGAGGILAAGSTLAGSGNLLTSTVGMVPGGNFLGSALKGPANSLANFTKTPGVSHVLGGASVAGGLITSYYAGQTLFHGSFTKGLMQTALAGYSIYSGLGQLGLLAGGLGPIGWAIIALAAILFLLGALGILGHSTKNRAETPADQTAAAVNTATSGAFGSGLAPLAVGAVSIIAGYGINFVSPTAPQEIRVPITPQTSAVTPGSYSHTETLANGQSVYSTVYITPGTDALGKPFEDVRVLTVTAGNASGTGGPTQVTGLGTPGRSYRSIGQSQTVNALTMQGTLGRAARSAQPVQQGHLLAAAGSLSQDGMIVNPQQ